MSRHANAARFDLPLSPEEARAAFRAFADEVIAPHAGRIDAEERIPPAIIRMLARGGYLGSVLPTAFGGGGADPLSYGMLNEEMGRASASVHGLLNVHNMTAHAVLRWGSRTQKTRWLPRLASGETIAAFALTEESAGSDVKSVATTATEDAHGYVLNGCKKWITCGQIADVFLILARGADGLGAFLVERDTPGLTTTPITGMIGCRAYMLAEVNLSACCVPRDNLVGRMGFGLSHVAATGLDVGRYGLAWCCVGIAQACLDACVRHTSDRNQFGVPLRDHQLVQQMITRMVANSRAARLLCEHAGRLREQRHPGAIMETAVAKYFASTALTRIAHDAVQLHGASGCSGGHPVGRYLRDAKIMELIEGTTQIQEIAIARSCYREYAR